MTDLDAAADLLARLALLPPAAKTAGAKAAAGADWLTGLGELVRTDPRAQLALAGGAAGAVGGYARRGKARDALAGGLGGAALGAGGGELARRAGVNPLAALTAPAAGPARAVTLGGRRVAVDPAVARDPALRGALAAAAAPPAPGVRLVADAADAVGRAREALPDGTLPALGLYGGAAAAAAVPGVGTGLTKGVGAVARGAGGLTAGLGDLVEGAGRTVRDRLPDRGLGAVGRAAGQGVAGLGHAVGAGGRLVNRAADGLIARGGFGAPLTQAERARGAFHTPAEFLAGIEGKLPKDAVPGARQAGKLKELFDAYTGSAKPTLGHVPSGGPGGPVPIPRAVADMAALEAARAKFPAGGGFRLGRRVFPAGGRLGRAGLLAGAAAVPLGLFARDALQQDAAQQAAAKTLLDRLAAQGLLKDLGPAGK